MLKAIAMRWSPWQAARQPPVSTWLNSAFPGLRLRSRGGSDVAVQVISRCGWCAAREENDRTRDLFRAAHAAGCRGFQPEISSFRLHLAAEGKAAKTVRTDTEAVQWFAAAYLRRQGTRRCWEEVRKRDVQERVAWLLGWYSAAYASNQYRALQQFFKWLAGEEEIPDPMAGLRPPRVPDKPVPVFAGDELSRGVCAGRGFPERGAWGAQFVPKADSCRVFGFSPGPVGWPRRPGARRRCPFARFQFAGRGGGFPVRT
jgi:hypothetical protein